MPNISSRGSRNNRQLVDLLTACGVTHLVVHGTSGSTSSEMIPSIQLETSGGVLSTVDMVVQRRDSPHWLRDDDALIRTKNERNGKHVQPVSCSLAMSGLKMPWCDSPSGWVTSTSTSPHVGRPRRYEPHASATTPGCIDSAISLTYSMIQQTGPLIHLKITSTTTTTVLRPLYTSNYIGQHLQLRTGGFCWCKVLLPACPCWWQPAHMD